MDLNTITLGTLFQSLQDHFWVALIAFGLFMFWIYAKPIGLYLGPLLKEYWARKTVLMEQRDQAQTKINERYFSLYEKSMDKLSEAVLAMKEVLIASKAEIKSEISLSENRLHQKIDDKFDQVKESILNDRIEKLAIRQGSAPNYPLSERLP